MIMVEMVGGHSSRETQAVHYRSLPTPLVIQIPRPSGWETPCRMATVDLTKFSVLNPIVRGSGSRRHPLARNQSSRKESVSLLYIWIISFDNTTKT